MSNNEIKIQDWKIKVGESVSIGDFNNVTDVENYGFFPGQRGDGANEIKLYAEPNLQTLEYNADDYAFSIYKSEYFYGIKKDNTEILGIYDNGVVIPVTEGSGGFNFATAGKNKILYAQTDVKNFEICKIDGYDAITVYYNTTGENDGAAAKTTYIFKERCISTVSYIRCIGMAEGFRDPSFERKHISIPSVAKNRIAYATVYPENGEFAFNDAESYVLSEQYDEKTFFCFAKHMKTEKAKAIGYGINSLPVILPENSEDVDLVYEVDYSVADADSGEAYFGLFKGRNMDFAAGVVSVDKNDNTTFFKGLETVLNINVTNISDNDINFSVKYNIVNHYNEEVAAHTYLNNKLNAGKSANRNISISVDKYGMYYLNLYVTTENYEYREIYTFAMIEDFECKYRKENPFGICETHHESNEHEKSIIRLLNSLGVSIVRASAATSNEFLDKMIDSGIPRFAMGCASNNREENIENYQNRIRQDLNRYGDKIAYYFLNNETDSGKYANYDKCVKYLKEIYLPYAYLPAYEVISKEYPHILEKTIWQSNCHATLEWLEAFYECGMWDNSAQIDIHTYSSPSGPDKVFSSKPVSMHANTFSNEFSMVRWHRATKRYGNKRMIVGETGYPAPPACGNVCEVDYRTQADFNARIVCFLLEAGAQDIIFYSLLDRPSYFVGTGAWNEMYFGAFHNYDYYGVYQPKVWAPAYANLIKLFDGYAGCYKNQKYEEDEFGTVRAFDVKTKENGNFTILWSNIYMQPNTTAEGRVNKVQRMPLDLWETRWLKTETREFDTVSDTVRVVDIMGNEKIYKAENGKIELELSGSPIYVYGIK